MAFEVGGGLCMGHSAPLRVSIDIFVFLFIVAANYISFLYMDSFDHLHTAPHVSAQKIDLKTIKEEWANEGCLPEDGASDFIRKFESDVRNGKVQKDELERIIGKVREAMRHADKSAQGLLNEVLRIAGVTENEIEK